MTLDGETHRLTRTQAAALRDDLDEALVDRREFTRTACVYRSDGAYVVERRSADSSGHSKVFDSVAECNHLFERLPEEFTATDVQRTGVTGGRRHLLVWHFVERDAFPCELVSRQPLTAKKTGAARLSRNSSTSDGVADD